MQAIRITRMIKRILSKDLAAYVRKSVRVRGWLNNLREMGKLNFLMLRDSSGLCQIVITDKEELRKLKGFHPGTILTVEGLVVLNNEHIEITDPVVTVENPVYETPPLEYYKPTMAGELEFILDNRPIALRNRRLQAVFKIQAEIVHAYRLFMHDKIGAIEYFAPNIIGASSEGGAEFFTVDYFGHTATLAQSSQLYKQMMVGVNERVFALMPFFRAEPSHTPRHLSEGKQFEFEMGFFDHWHELLEIQEECIKVILQHLWASCMEEMQLFETIKAPLEIPFPRLTYIEAQELFYQRTGIDERNEPDLSPAAERELCKWALEEKGTDLLFVTDWLTEKRPFYSYPNEKNPELSNTMDLLCGGIEISSGGQRRHTHASMVEGIITKGMNPEHFKDYLSIFRYGMPCHGGFGIGLERLTMTILKLKNIREVSLFPSDPKRIAGVRIRSKIFFGSENIRNEIIRILKYRSFDYKYLIHEETPALEESACMPNPSYDAGIKALILRTKNSKKNVQINIPGHKKVDMRAVAEAVGEKCEFEDPEVIFERFGLKVGGIPPFGTLLNIETYFDIGIRGCCHFNCGFLTETIEMNAEELLEIVQPRIGLFAK